MKSATIEKEFDAKVDARGRINLRNPSSQFYHVRTLRSGKVILEPKFIIAEETLRQIEAGVENFKKGIRGTPINLKEWPDV